MKKNKKKYLSLIEINYIESLQAKMQSVMPEVCRQIKVYEEKLNQHQLSLPPKNPPLFSE